MSVKMNGKKFDFDGDELYQGRSKREEAVRKFGGNVLIFLACLAGGAIVYFPLVHLLERIGHKILLLIMGFGL